MANVSSYSMNDRPNVQHTRTYTDLNVSTSSTSILNNSEKIKIRDFDRSTSSPQFPLTDFNSSLDFDGKTMSTFTNLCEFE